MGEAIKEEGKLYCIGCKLNVGHPHGHRILLINGSKVKLLWNEWLDWDEIGEEA